MNKQVSESIFDDGINIIPFAEVSHIERMQHKDYNGWINIIFKHSKWVDNPGAMEPVVEMDAKRSESFLKSWCRYRNEVEAIAPFEPDGSIVEQMRSIWGTAWNKGHAAERKNLDPDTEFDNYKRQYGL